jgi:hypothetical protein
MPTSDNGGYVYLRGISDVSKYHETKRIFDPPKYGRKHWFTPPPYDPTQRYERALWWVREVAKALQDSAETFFHAEAVGESESERARARAAVASDRAYLEFWITRLRKLGSILKVPPTQTAQEVGEALAGLEAVGTTYRTLLDPTHLPAVVRAATRRTGREPGAQAGWDEVNIIKPANE